MLTFSSGFFGTEKWFPYVSSKNLVMENRQLISFKQILKIKGDSLIDIIGIQEVDNYYTFLKSSFLNEGYESV
jgi:hypothetical protein